MIANFGHYASGALLLKTYPALQEEFNYGKNRHTGFLFLNSDSWILNTRIDTKFHNNVIVQHTERQ